MMTAGQLSDALRAFEPDTEVVLEVDAFCWTAIDRLIGPNVADQPDRADQAICLTRGERVA